jgi:cholesterol transport system auxiliary component
MLALAFLAMLASGCGGLLHTDTPADQTYILRAAPAAEAIAATGNEPSLRIGRTLVAPGLDADRILLVRDDHRMDYFTASRWAASIPQMVEDLAAQTLRNSGVWSSVHDSQGAFPTDYYLQLDIRRFEADYTEGVEPKIYVVLNCTLGRRTDREHLKSFVAEGSASAGTNRLGAVVAAFESATQAALATIAEQGRLALKTSTAPSTP